MPVSATDTAAARLAAARRDFAQGRTQQARAACLELLGASPAMGGALHLLGLIGLREAHPAAEDLLRRAAASPDAQALYLLSYAELCVRERDPVSALALTRRAVSLEPHSALAWHSLGAQLLTGGAGEESRACFERALELSPDLWRARAQLGIVLARLGRVQEGDRCFERLLLDRAHDPTALDLFAGYLADQGRLFEASMQAERAIEAAPEILEHQLHGVEIDLQRQRLGAALERLELLRVRWPRDPRPITLMLEALQRADRAHEAVDLAQASLADGIDSADLWRAYGSALHVAGRPEEALCALERAQHPRPAPALNERGIVLSHLGRFAEAVAAFEQALVHQPAFAPAWYNKAHAKHFQPGDPDIEALERQLECPGAHLDRILVHFALGKALDEAGDPSRAFAHWHRGNALKRATLRYDPEAAVHELELAGARPCWPAEPDPHAGPRSSEVPVFIVGMPRCGSTLVEQMLASHPEVASAGEQSGARAQIERYAANGAASGSSAAPTTASPQDATDTKTSCSAEACAAAVLAALRRYSDTARRILDKDLRNFRYLDLIHRLFPRARIVHCRRDPLDTCFSAYTMLFAGDFPYTYELRELGRYYCAYRNLMQIWRARLPAHVLLEIDYETLVSTPRATCERLLGHLGLPWNESCLAFHESGRSIRTASLMQARRPLYRSSVGRGARHAAELQALIEALSNG